MTQDEIKELLRVSEKHIDECAEQCCCSQHLIGELVDLVEKLTTWRPMERAPRDGTSILVLTRAGFYTVAYWPGFQADDRGWLPLVPEPVVKR